MSDFTIVIEDTTKTIVEVGTQGPPGPKGDDGDPVISPAWNIIATDTLLVSGQRYMIDTTLTPINVTLPVTPVAGDVVVISDYANTFQSNNVVVLRNGTLIENLTANLTLDTKGTYTLEYVDPTKGWLVS